MDKTTLTSFITTAEVLSFSKAAEKLFVTQPAISKRINQLEQQLNCQLFTRQNKEVLLTPEGAIFLQHAKQILQAMQNSQTAIQNMHTRISGLLSIGISHHIGLHRMPSVLKIFSDTYPDVHLQIRFITSEEAVELIQNHELEIAIITLPKQAPDKLITKQLWLDTLQFVASSQHALVSKSQTPQRLTLHDLAQHPAILPSFDTYTGQLIQQLFIQHGVTITHFIETNNLETIRMMTSIGLGWSVLPRIMLNKQLQGLIFSDDIALAKRHLGYIHHKNRTLSSAANALINILLTTNNPQ